MTEATQPKDSQPEAQPKDETSEAEALFLLLATLKATGKCGMYYEGLDLVFLDPAQPLNIYLGTALHEYAHAHHLDWSEEECDKWAKGILMLLVKGGKP